jgi:hypothetical protein
LLVRHRKSRGRQRFRGDTRLIDVRKLWVAVAISGAAHLLVVAWLVDHRPEPRDLTGAPEPTTVEIVDVPKPPEPDVAPIDVAFLDESVAAAIPEPAAIPEAAPPPPAASHRPPRTSGAEPTTTPEITLPGAGTGSGSAVETAPIDPAKRNYLMSMRRGKVDIRIPKTDYGSAVDGAPAGTGPEKDLTSGRLAPSGSGTYRTDEGVFVARVDPGGNAKIKDAKNFNVHFALPGLKDIGRGVADWYEQPNKWAGDDSDAERKAPLASKIQVSPGSTTDKDDRSKTAVVPLLAGSFDITDAFMRSHGQDPYASKKLAYLDSTRDERVQIGSRHRQQQLKQATQIMQGNLDRLWSTQVDAQARKQALFELWDECAETGSGDLIEAGAEARRLVIGFIRARLPAGGATEFTADEVVAFNRTKQSKATFTPYE